MEKNVIEFKIIFVPENDNYKKLEYSNLWYLPYFIEDIEYLFSIEFMLGSLLEFSKDVKNEKYIYEIFENKYKIYYKIRINE